MAFAFLFYSTLLRNQLIPFGNNVSVNTKVFKPAPDDSQTVVINVGEIRSLQALTTSLEGINKVRETLKRSAPGKKHDKYAYNLSFYKKHFLYLSVF